MARKPKRTASRRKRSQKKNRDNQSSLIVVILLAVLLGFFAISIIMKSRKIDLPIPTPPSSTVRAEVLNGCGKIGLARAATRELRRRGVDVVFLGNAPEMSHEKTVLIDRGGGEDILKYIGHMMGCGTFLTKPDGNDDRDLTIILGMDYEDLFPDRSKPEKGWWIYP